MSKYSNSSDYNRKKETRVWDRWPTTAQNYKPTVQSVQQNKRNEDKRYIRLVKELIFLSVQSRRHGRDKEVKRFFLLYNMIFTCSTKRVPWKLSSPLIQSTVKSDHRRWQLPIQQTGFLPGCPPELTPQSYYHPQFLESWKKSTFSAETKNTNIA